MMTNGFVKPSNAINELASIFGEELFPTDDHPLMTPQEKKEQALEIMFKAAQGGPTGLTTEEYNDKPTGSGDGRDTLSARLMSWHHLTQGDGLADLIATGNEAAIRIATLEAELLATCQREAATHARHDAKIAALEAQVAAADRLAELWGEFDKPLLQFGSFGEMRKAARNALAAYRAAKGE